MHYHQKGFTLLELMIVVAVLGILSAIAIPNIERTLLEAEYSRAKSNLKAVSTAIESYRSVNGTYPQGFHRLGADLVNATPAYLSEEWAENYFVDAGETYSNVYTEIGKMRYLYRSPAVGLGDDGIGERYFVIAYGRLGVNYGGVERKLCVDHTGTIYSGSDSVSSIEGNDYTCAVAMNTAIS